ncbi:MAG: arylsulfatase [Candidatus Marinimicrobia bacterium]|nr:arylsulfatase [Candidatus Neomarinimicrobiota bacterium]
MYISKILEFLYISYFLLFFVGCGKNNELPNIILILTDDQGYGDLGCYGAEGFKTPHIDGMANEGILFTDFYVSQAVCSASRASLMTGSYSERVGIQGALSPWDVNGLDPDTETIAKLLKRHGYINAIFGKWHLGHSEKFLPLQNGFDEFSGLICSNDMWPVDYDGKPFNSKKKSYYPPMFFWEQNSPKEEIKGLADQSQLTTKLTEYSLNFIKRNKDNPFFLYLPHPMPHQPIAVSKKFKGKSELGLYGDVIMEIDWSVGQILNSLKENNIDKNTLIIFASDNGPWLNFGKWGGSAGPLREGKGTMWEGGARVPCIVRWPKKIKPKQVLSNIASTIDIFPTLAEIVGENKINKKIDGVSLLPLFEGEPNANPRNELFYYYNEKLIAVRKDDWKLVFPHTYRSYENVEPGKNLYPGPYGKGEAGLELYNLDSDIGERDNLIEKYPLIVKELEKISDRARNILGDQLTDRIGSESYSTVCGYKQQKNNISHMGKGKILNLINNANIKYFGEDQDALINGNIGTIDHKDPSWLGFEAEDLIATIDLGSVEKINFVETRFLQSQVFWIFLPKKIQIEHSIDGENFHLLYEVNPENDYSFEQKIFKYSIRPLNVESRFIRLRANNINKCPEYHPGSGGKSWLFTDEIVIN